MYDDAIERISMRDSLWW